MAQQRVQGTRRVWVPAAFFFAFTLVIAARLVQVQVIEHKAYAERAATELKSGETRLARRGAILDRNGNVLATSVDTWDIYVSPRSWQDPVNALQAADALARLLANDIAQPKVDASQLRAQVGAGGTGDVLIARDVSYETGRLILGSSITGVTGIVNSARIHPEGDTGASVLGIIGQENSGLAGIEAQYNSVLQGKPGKAIFERDTTGDPIPFGEHVVTDPQPGKDIVLTIDRYIQRQAEYWLEKGIKDHRAKGGAIIVMDPRNGEILALASSPGLKYSTLDLSDAAQGDLLRNRTVTDLYEPGSVMKVITAAAAIDAGVVSPGTTYVDTGIAYIYDIPIKNWDDSVYGTQTMTGVLQHSINTGAIFMVEKLGQKAFHSYLDAFGFGRPTGIDLNGESTGIIRRPTDDDWSPVDLATQSFGQSISVTPLQMLSAVAATINGGRLIKPRLARAFVGPDGVREEVRPEIVGEPISETASATIRQMLYDVVNPEGRTYPGAPVNYTAGGKSGTANVPIPNGYDDRQVASFIGFAPADAPQILVLVKLDENNDLMTGTQAASPIFAKLADDVLAYLNVRPDSARYVSR
ncbi:MAG: penicillin-binding protein 2 [Thermoflexaceae bacterium]|nr:penicillin-binding protein 2 [Thermoflexaceae bacterium]